MKPAPKRIFESMRFGDKRFEFDFQLQNPCGLSRSESLCILSAPRSLEKTSWIRQQVGGADTSNLSNHVVGAPPCLRSAN